MTPRRWTLSRVGSSLVSNLPYKILSVLIALALWFIVRDERVETTVIYALDLQAPAELVVGNESVPELTVAVAGTRVALDRLRRGQLVMPVKLKATEPGVLTLHLRPEDVLAPAGVEVVHVAPATVGVRLETRRSRTVLVRPRIILEEESAWRVKKVTLMPERVRISGPASVIAVVDQVWTEAIAIPGKSGEAISGNYAVSLPHPQIHVDDNAAIAVTVELEPANAPPAPSPIPSQRPKR